MSSKDRSALRYTGTIVVHRPNNQTFEMHEHVSLTRPAVEHVVNEAVLRIRNGNGWTPTFSVIRDDGVNVTMDWLDVIGR